MQDILPTLSMEAHRVTTFSLLAHINNNDSGIKDFAAIFLPLVKSTLSKMSDRGRTKGKSILEIKNVVDANYSLDMPLPLLRKLLNRIADEENRKSNGAQFTLFQDDAFIIREYVFTEHLEIIRRQETEITNLNEAYITFLKANNRTVSVDSTLFSFLDQNRRSLSRYFASSAPVQPEGEDEENGAVNAEFIELVKRTSQKDFDLLRRIYLGSIIAGYLEIKAEEVKEDVEFVVDTNFIIGLLDLTSESSSHTCLKILEICKRFGYKVSVLDITLRETQQLLKAIGSNLEKSFMEKRLDRDSISYACDRKNLERTDLEKMAGDIKELLAAKGISVLHDSSRYENEAKQVPGLLDYFESIRRTKFSALHDATAVVYVRKKRNKPAVSFYNANCWFVTHTPHSLNHHSITLKGAVPELIRAEDLVNILWLSNPAVSGTGFEVADLGLTRLIASAYNESLPSARILREFDDNLRKYAKGVSATDIVRVGSAIAHKTISNLEVENLNTLSGKSPEEFVNTLRKVAAKEAESEAQRLKAVETLLSRTEEETRERIQVREKELELRSRKELEESSVNLTARLASQQEAALTRLSDEKDLEILSEKLKSSSIVKTECERKASRNTKIAFVLVAVGLLLLIGSILQWNLWGKIGLSSGLTESLNSITKYASLVALAMLAFALIGWEQELMFAELDLKETKNLVKIKKMLISKKLVKVQKRNNFDAESHKEIEDKIARLNEKIAKPSD